MYRTAVPETNIEIDVLLIGRGVNVNFNISDFGKNTGEETNEVSSNFCVHVGGISYSRVGF
jgi:hypothetical protein